MSQTRRGAEVVADMVDLENVVVDYSLDRR